MSKDRPEMSIIFRILNTAQPLRVEYCMYHAVGQKTQDVTTITAQQMNEIGFEDQRFRASKLGHIQN